MQEPSAYHQIQRLFSVLLLGVVAAIAVASFFLYFFNPKVSYPLKDILVNPEVAEGLKFQDGGVLYVFDRIEFLHFNEVNRSWDKKKLTLEQYKKFYLTVKSDKSEPFPDDQITEKFYESNPALLSIVVKKASGEGDQVFQEVQISPSGNVYRVKLRQDQEFSQWGYFLHDDIYQITLDIFEGGYTDRVSKFGNLTKGFFSRAKGGDRSKLRRFASASAKSGEKRSSQKPNFETRSV